MDSRYNVMNNLRSSLNPFIGHKMHYVRQNPAQMKQRTLDKGNRFCALHAYRISYVTCVHRSRDSTAGERYDNELF